MPVGDYSWIEPEEAVKRDWTQSDDSDNMAHLVLCDLEYPEELHDLHNSLPLAPTKSDIDETMMSPYSLECFRLLNRVEKHKSSKLVTTFLARTEYLVHQVRKKIIFYLVNEIHFFFSLQHNLALYLKLGMRLTKVHKCLRFRQSNFLAEYIAYCTRMRATSHSVFKQNMWKFSNSVFGQ